MNEATPSVESPPIRRIEQYECGGKRIDVYGDNPPMFIGHGWVQVPVANGVKLQPLQFQINATDLEDAFAKIDAHCQAAGDKYLTDLQNQILVPGNSGLKIAKH